MKRLVCLLIALCLTAALFSCTDKSETKQEEKTPSITETPTEITTPNEVTLPSENDTTTAKEYLPIIENKFLHVLKNEVPYYQESDVEAYFFQWVQSIDENADYNSLDNLEYALSDMNNDGNQELIIKKHTSRYLVLYDIGKRIKGDEYRIVCSPKSDGTWMWYYADSNGEQNIRIEFEIKYDLLSPIELCSARKMYSLDPNMAYYIGDTKVTKEEYNEYESQFSDEDLLFYSLESYIANNM